MVQNDKRLTAEKTVMALEEVLGRLEKALASKQVRSQSGICEQADFIHQLEKENRALPRELDVARANVEKLEERIEALEQAGGSAQKEMGLMIEQLDVLITEQNAN
jgi:ferritin-like metal-binding protein YciE